MTDPTSQPALHSATPTLHSTTEEAALGPYDAEHPPPLDFEAWMDLCATLIERTPEETDDILDANNVTPDLWRAVNLFWLNELNRQVARLNFKLAARFGERCAAELRARPTPSDAPPLPELDETAFMTALPDDTVVPFAAPHATPQPIDPASSLSGTHAETGETVEVAAIDVPDGTLPFDD